MSNDSSFNKVDYTLHTESQFTVFVASTPRHLYQSIALAFQEITTSIPILIVYGIESGTSLLDVLEDKQFSPFTHIEFIEQGADSSYKKVLDFSQIRSRIDELITMYKPNKVFVGNDFKPISQRILYRAKIENPKCIAFYVEDGTASYFRFEGKMQALSKRLEGRIKMVLYGRWFDRPHVIGTSKYIDKCMFSYPTLILKGYEKSVVDRFPSESFLDSRVQAVVNRICEINGFDFSRLEICSALVILPRIKEIDRYYGSIKALFDFLNNLKDSGHTVAIKYHPRDAFGCEQLNGIDGLVIVPTFLPIEMVYSRLHSNAIILGDLSSALFTARWLLPTADVYAIGDRSSVPAVNVTSLFKKVGVKMLSMDELSELNSKVAWL